MSNAPSSPRSHDRLSWWKPLLFIIVAVVGLYYVKWSPYYLKSFVAADQLSIGASILDDHQTAPLAAALIYAKAYFLAVWKAAVLAIVLGSLVQVLIPRNWLLRTLGRDSTASIVRGGLFALPGMMCSCCAAPLVAGLRRQNVSVGAALAFWIANPVLNPATLIFMGFVLGWGFTVLRLIAGIALVLGVSVIAQRIATTSQPSNATVVAINKAAITPSGNLFERWLRAIWQLCWRVIPVYIVAVLILGAVRVWLLPATDGMMFNSILWLVPLTIIGTLFVIPTAAEIPIVQTLMTVGMQTGPAAVLLMTLPSISLPSLLMLRGSFPPRVLVSVALLTMLVGLVTGGIAALLL